MGRAARPAKVHLLGRMRALGPQGQDLLPPAKKTQAVLGYLCLAEGKPIPRNRLAGTIWDHTDNGHALESLRQALGQIERSGEWCIERDRDALAVDLTGCWIDALENPEPADLLLEGLYGISPGFDQWLFGERLRYERRWEAILGEQLNELITTNAPPERRASVARKLLNILGAHEPAVRAAMAAFVEMGDRAQAIREYERLRRVMMTTFGMPPSETTVALYEAIRLDARVRAARATLDARAGGAPASEERDVVVPGTTPGALVGTPVGRDPSPSIAILPFKDLSPGQRNQHIAAGIVEDLVELLSRVPDVFVVSRLSAAAFRNQDRPPVELGEALGVQYLISGSLRVVEDRLRLSVELTDAVTGMALWVSRLDESFSDLLTAQSDLAEAVVRQVAPHVRAAQLKRLRTKRPEDHDAYDLFLRAQESMHSLSREVFADAGQLLDRAIARQPQYAAALAWRAHWHVLKVGQGWSADPIVDRGQAEYFAEHAIQCDPTEALAFAVRGHVTAYLRKDFDGAFEDFETALRLNANCARAWLWSATAHAWTGKGSLAVEQVNRAMALSPYDPLEYAYSGAAAMAYLADGQYGRAIEFALRCMRENRSYTTAHKVLILGLVFTGAAAEARGPANRLLAIEPRFSVALFRQRSPSCAGPNADRFCEALATAGVPRGA